MSFFHKLVNAKLSKEFANTILYNDRWSLIVDLVTFFYFLFFVDADYSPDVKKIDCKLFWF